MNVKNRLISLTIVLTSLIGMLFVSTPTFAALLDASSFKFDGYYRVRQIYYYNLPQTTWNTVTLPGAPNPVNIPATNYNSSQRNTSYFDQRFRLEPQLNINEAIVIKSQIDMLDNTFWGNNVDPGNSIYTGNPSNNSAYYPYSPYNADGSLANIDVKRVWLEYTSPFGKFSIGRMPYGFGLGVLYNNGDGFKNEWGDAYYGNTADQIQFTTMPMGIQKPLLIVLDYAKIKANSPYSPYDDDDWYTFIPGYMTQKLTAMLLLQHQEQNVFKKNINLAELYVNTTPIKNLNILLDYFYISGHLNPFESGSTAAGVLQSVLGTDQLKVVDAQGGVLRGTYNMSPLEYVLEIGFSPANGKSSSDIETYPFSNDYNSSLILFNNTGLGAPNTFVNPTYTALNEAGSYNANYTAIPPESSVKDDFLYFAPMVKFTPADFLHVKLQYMYAEANDFVNYAGGTKLSRDLGNEIDLGVDTTLSNNFIFGFQTGYFMPGAVFKNENNYAPNIFAFETRFTVLF